MPLVWAGSLAAIENDGTAAGEVARLLACQQQALRLIYLGQQIRNGIDIDRFGFKARQSQHDRLAGAVPFAGLAERAVTLHFDPHDVRQMALQLELLDEGIGGTHGANGMGRGGANPDGKQVKHADHDINPVMVYVCLF